MLAWQRCCRLKRRSGIQAPHAASAPETLSCPSDHHLEASLRSRDACATRCTERENRLRMSRHKGQPGACQNLKFVAEFCE